MVEKAEAEVDLKAMEKDGVGGEPFEAEAFARTTSLRQWPRLGVAKGMRCSGRLQAGGINGDGGVKQQEQRLARRRGSGAAAAMVVGGGAGVSSCWFPFFCSARDGGGGLGDGATGGRLGWRPPASDGLCVAWELGGPVSLEVLGCGHVLVVDV